MKAWNPSLGRFYHHSWVMTFSPAQSGFSCVPLLIGYCVLSPLIMKTNALMIIPSPDYSLVSLTYEVHCYIAIYFFPLTFASYNPAFRSCCITSPMQIQMWRSVDVNIPYLVYLNFFISCRMRNRLCMKGYYCLSSTTKVNAQAFERV